MKRWNLFYVMCLYLLFLVWLGGFIVFQQYIRKHPTDEQTHTDAIVVLTGGKNRIAEGVRLYNKGLSDMLFISGVFYKSGLQDMEHLNNIVVTGNLKNVILGKEATNTVENAIEVSEMIRRNQVKSIRLVTSYYHMPRSVEEILRRNPDVILLEYPVFSKSVAKRWWKKPKSFCLIASEYHKFVFAYLKNLFFKMKEGFKR